MTGVLGDLEDPDSGETLLEAWCGDLRMLGSGSDYAGRFIVGRGLSVVVLIGGVVCVVAKLVREGWRGGGLAENNAHTSSHVTFGRVMDKL